MPTGGRQHLGSRLGALAALVALLFQFAVPSGVMVSGGVGAAALVICTGHGPLALRAPHGRPGKAPVPTPHGVCAFSGHAASAPTSAGPSVDTVTSVAGSAPAAPLVDLIPGRGLAAPPPPPQGPPSLLI